LIRFWLVLGAIIKKKVPRLIAIKWKGWAKYNTNL
jgi:hypothetical protein